MNLDRRAKSGIIISIYKIKWNLKVSNLRIR